GRIMNRPEAELIAAAQGSDSDARFAAVLASLTVRAGRAASLPLRDRERMLGTASRGRSKAVIELSGDGLAFGDWLINNIDKVHRSWLEASGAED
ncbi:hypothetical protein D3P06_17975, partial [Paracoccus aestuarii]